MYGRHFVSFLKKLDKMMKINTIVQRGWYYRNKPIADVRSSIGIVIDEPYMHESTIEKLTFCGKTQTWDAYEEQGPSLSVTVLWENNEMVAVPIRNLVRV